MSITEDPVDLRKARIKKLFGQANGIIDQVTREPETATDLMHDLRGRLAMIEELIK